MQTHNLGYPRIGNQRRLKKASEQYWAGKISANELEQTAKKIRQQNWQTQKDAGINLVPCNDFSFYDHVLDTALMVGAIPERYHSLINDKQLSNLDILFAMARGYQKDGYDITAMEMTKWFDTNYHYIVPEFTASQKFVLYSEKVLNHFNEAKRDGFSAKPVLLGPVSFLLLGKEKEKGCHRIELIKNLLPVYIEIIKKLEASGAYFIQFDEPCLSLNLTDEERKIFASTYNELSKTFPGMHFFLASYFECYGDNLSMVLSLPITTLHLDLVRCPLQLDDILAAGIKNKKLNLSLGVVDGRNIWKNDYEQSLEIIKKAAAIIQPERIWIAPSCSLLHVPCDLDLETDELHLPATIKNWMAFAKQKLKEVAHLASLASETPSAVALQEYEKNKHANRNRQTSALIHKQEIKDRVKALTQRDAERASAFEERKQLQQKVLQLPLLPTTTIGSFPQTTELRAWRAKWKKGELTNEAYDALIKDATAKAIHWQDEIGIDVLVHGEFERNDMVEYFGEQLDGFAFTKNGWVQSYGSRCVKPPVIVGDVSRKNPMTVYYTSYAQSLTETPVKGMLTGPVTILQWSFVRNDQPRSETCMQIACAIRDEVTDLEKAGIKVIQIDEPAIREGLPLRRENWNEYLQWAVTAFKVASTGVKDETQIHTHMCYSEFNDIIASIAAMDADVITIETSRSQMELLDVFAAFKYPNDIGPGVYDIHSPRVPSKQEMIHLLFKALEVLPAQQLWINPDCGLKTRGWDETKTALQLMVDAARELRSRIGHTVQAL
ncbi:MAG: 5-methyltetrahydropteroyltriglutamate--homocysteine S-methyltransferase [Chitinophagaceae bacterium]